MLLSLIGFL